MFKKSDTLREAPGKFAEVDPDQVIFNQHHAQRVDRNWWRLLCLLLVGALFVALWTRVSPPPQVKSYGLTSDDKGNIKVRQLTEFKPEDREIRSRIKDALNDWFTIEPNLAGALTQSRTAIRIRRAEAMMVGSAKRQFGEWFARDQPIAVLAQNKEASREVEVRSVQILPDQTALVDLILNAAATPTQKPTQTRFNLTLRYQIIPSENDVALTDNPAGVYFPFFQLTETSLK